MNIQDRPYQLVAFCGTTTAPSVEGVKLVDLTYKHVEGPEHPVLAVLRESNLTAADVRSRILFAMDQGIDALTATTTYAALSAFCGRRVDASLGTDRRELHAVDLEHRAAVDTGRPEVVADTVIVGEGDATAALGDDEDATVLRLPLSNWTSDELSTLRWAKRVIVALPESPLDAIDAFVRVAAARVRSDADRFPVLVAKETAVDADELRRVSTEVRRSHRHDAGAIFAEKVPLSAGSRDMLAACAVPIEAVMLALGSSTQGEGLWHCPRPRRHSNGDANASMRVERGKGRCFRCDSERVDAVRLVADSRAWSASEATDWILSEVAPRAAELVASVEQFLPQPAPDQPQE
jgi:hypothetical protein